MGSTQGQTPTAAFSCMTSALIPRRRTLQIFTLRLLPSSRRGFLQSRSLMISWPHATFRRAAAMSRTRAREPWLRRIMLGFLGFPTPLLFEALHCFLVRSGRARDGSTLLYECSFDLLKEWSLTFLDFCTPLCIKF